MFIKNCLTILIATPLAFACDQAFDTTDPNVGLNEAALSARGDGFGVSRGERPSSCDIAGACLADPKTMGPFNVAPVVYAAPGLSYPSPRLDGFQIFETPTSVDWHTGERDVSSFGPVDRTAYLWPFDARNVLINGVARIPDGPGPFPLVLIQHGKKGAEVNSTLGFDYLLDLLSSHGIIVASIDCNFYQGDIQDDTDSRAIVLLEHALQFKRWNSTKGHPLAGRVDTTRVMIVGHSRGGEAVEHASYFNRLSSVTVLATPLTGSEPSPKEIMLDGTQGLGPYNFGLRAIVALAPTEKLWVPWGGTQSVRDDYFILQGSRDEDVRPFPGYKTYDRAHSVDLSDPTAPAEGTKSLLWLVAGSHAGFNELWSPGHPSKKTLPPPHQMDVARVWLGAIAHSRLLGDVRYDALLRDHRRAWGNGWLPPSSIMVSQYQDPDRLFLNHYEHQDAAAPSPPVTGSITVENMRAEESYFNTGYMFDPFQDTRGVRLTWLASAAGLASYTVTVDPKSFDGSALPYLVMRVGQSARELDLSGEPLNVPGTTQDFDITVSDGVHAHTVQASAYGTLSFPSELLAGGGLLSTHRSVMQTLRIPLRTFANKGVDVDGIAFVKLSFNRPQSGTQTVAGELYLDDLQLSR